MVYSVQQNKGKTLNMLLILFICGSPNMDVLEVNEFSLTM